MAMILEKNTIVLLVPATTVLRDIHWPFAPPHTPTRMVSEFLVNIYEVASCVGSIAYYNHQRNPINRALLQLERHECIKHCCNG